MNAEKSADETYRRAVRLLGFRARSVTELRRQLLRKGESPDHVELTIGRLLEQKLLDDTDFARQFARTRFTAAGSSRRRVLQELARRGVARDVANRAIAELWDTDRIEPNLAVRHVAEKKWKSLAEFEEFTRRRRLYAFLARRGFDPDEIKSVMSTLGEELDA